MNRVLKCILLALAVLLLLIAVFAAWYVYRNMNYDKGTEQRMLRAGFVEKQATLPDGTVINYGEGPDNGPPLLLIHGQMTSWEDYEKVLPKLSRRFHVFAVDCHGHGGSSKNPEKYSAISMGNDLIWFLEQVIKAPAIVSGHSSGGLLAAWLAANSPEHVRGVVLEDPPFFSTETGRREATYAWRDGFETIHAFLNQAEETNYTCFYLEHTYLRNFFGESWNGIQKYANAYLERHPGERLRIFFLPPSMNRAFDLLAGDYDLRFGDTFYDNAWMEGYDHAKTLAKINCPSVLIHTNWSYDEQRVLLAAMSGEDARRAHELIDNNVLVNVKSGHDVHWEKPKEFTNILFDFLDTLPAE